MREILKEIRKIPHLNTLLSDTEKYPPPEAFCFSRKKFKVFVLGADPSNESDRGNTNLLRTVFGIGSGDQRYFNDILKNLKSIGLGLEDIYVQNLIPVYMKSETGKNKLWEEMAVYWIPHLKEELNKNDISGEKPVLVTAERILKVLMNDRKGLMKPEMYYLHPDNIPIEPDRNQLQRRLVPFYRHRRYRLDTVEWKLYTDKLRTTVHS
jgi:hypothetical protein